MHIGLNQNTRVLETWNCSLWIVNNKLLPIIIKCKDEIIQILNPNVDSIYLYGSVAQWKVPSSYSDLDIMIFLSDEVPVSQLNTIITLQDLLTTLYKDIFAYVGLDLVTPKMYLQDQPLVYWLLTKNLGIHIWGKPMDPYLPDNIYLDKHLWKELNSDYISRIDQKIKEFLTTEDLVIKKLACRWVMKKLLRTSFWLIIEKIDFFENDTDHLVNILSQFYPHQEDILKNIGRLVHNPSIDNWQVMYILNTYFPWLKNEWALVYW